jgi:hypothetical protein
MHLRIISMLGATALLAACNQSPDTDQSKANPVAPGGQEKAKVETSTNGVITKGLTEFELSPKALVKNTSTPWIGLIPTSDPALISCPDGQSAFRFDDEDDSNRNHFFVNGSDVSYHNYSYGGLIHSSSPWRAGGNTWIRYCNKQVNSLPTLSHDYAVISASNSCPANSTRFFKRWDDEDSGNHDATEGDVTPGWSSSNGGATGMYFCFVPAGSGPDWSSTFDGSFVFTRKALANRAQSDQDDEDDANNNGYSSDNSSYTTRMQALISGGSNTTIYIATASPATAVDMGTRTDCQDFQWKIGIKCDFDSHGTRNCKPIGGVEDYWSALKHTMCLF